MEDFSMAEELNNNVTNEPAGNVPAEEKISMTQAELDALLQKESDRRVSQALATQERKNNAKIREAEKVAQMNAQERYEYDLQQREQAILEKERALTLAENKNACAKVLAEKGLSLDLVDFVVDIDGDEMNRRIKLLDKAFKASVRAEIDKRLGSNTPAAATENKPITKADFSKMTLAQQTELYKSDRELYMELVK